MKTEWYYSKDDEQQGPVSFEELKELVSSGQLDVSDLVWNEEMSDWEKAGTITGLDQDDFSKTVSKKVSSGVKSTKRLLDRAGGFAQKVGDIASSAISEGELKDSDQPAIFLRAEFFGGRTRIGGSLSALSELGGRVFAAMASWIYLIWVVRSTVNAWQFLPLSKTEYVRIVLRQKVRWGKIAPAFVAWTVISLSVFVVCFIIAVLLKEKYSFLLANLLFVGGGVFANLIACNMIASLDIDSLHRSEIILEYGFPTKHRLLYGISDAPVEQQIEGVLKLCEAISSADFSRWEQFSSHGNGGLVSGLFNRVTSIMPGQ